MKYFLTGLIIALAASSPAAAQSCDLTASTSGNSLQKLYDPFAAQDTVVGLRVTVFNSGDQNCQARFYISPSDGQLRLSASGETMAYQIEGTTGGSLPGEYGPFSVTVAGGGRETVSIQFRVPGQQVVPVGFYTSNLALRGEGPENDPISIGGSNPILTMAVPARSETSISGAPSPSLSSLGMAPATINFPDAQMGQTGMVYVNVWANSSVLVRLTSQHGGVLKHLQNRNLPPIAYSATFDGNVIGLASAYSVQRNPPMSVAGASYPLLITLGDTTGRYAGRYQDRITVDVQSN